MRMIWKKKDIGDMGEEGRKKGGGSAIIRIVVENAEIKW